MKKTILLLMAAAMLCTFLFGCTTQPDAPTTQPTATTQPATEPTTVPLTEPPTQPVSEPTIGENITPPDDMPNPPENDYSLPPDERPGDRSEVSEY